MRSGKLRLEKLHVLSLKYTDYVLAGPRCIELLIDLCGVILGHGEVMWTEQDDSPDERLIEYAGLCGLPFVLKISTRDKLFR